MVGTETIKISGQDVRTLKELLRPGLRRFLFGINPSRVSADAGHYYQGKLGRRFWDRLQQYRITTTLPKRGEDIAAFNQGFGFADLIRRPTERDTLTRAEKRAGVDDLADRLGKTADKPLIVFTFVELRIWRRHTLRAAVIGHFACRMPTSGEISWIFEWKNCARSYHDDSVA